MAPAAPGARAARHGDSDWRRAGGRADPVTVLVPFGDRLATQVPRTGVMVGLYPSSSPDYDLQLYRAASTTVASVPTSSRFSELATLGVLNGQAGVTYVDSLPLTKTFWWYKARSVRTNVATPSAFTTAVSAQAGILPTSAPGVVPFSGRPLSVSVRLSTTATLQVASSTGGGSTGGYYVKRMIVPHGSFIPETTGDAVGVQHTAAYMRSVTAGVVSREHVAPVVLAPGVVVTDYALRAWRSTTSPQAFVTLSRIEADAATVLGGSAVKPTLVVVDALESWAEGSFQDANSSAELGTVMTSLRSVARSGPGLLVFHHANKSDGSYRGSSAIGAGCDVLVEMFPDEVDEAARVFKPRGRIRGLQGYTLKLDGNTYRVHAGELSPDARIIAHVAAAPGISRSALRDKIGGGHRAVDRVIEALVARGAIRDEVSPKGYHSYYPAAQGGGFGAGLEAAPEPALSTPHAGFHEATSQTLPLSEIPGGAGLEPPPGAGDAWEPAQ